MNSTEESIVGSYGIASIDPSTPNALICGTCGRAWGEDITPSGRCPFEDLHSTEEANRTCQERIAEHLKGREGDVDLLMRCANITNDGIPASPDIIDKLTDLGVDMSADTGEEWEESALEVLDNLPLEISITTTLKVLLSTGGPADYLTAEIVTGEPYRTPDGRTCGNPSWERTSDVVYHFADWFDHAETTLAEDSPLVTWFDSIVETYSEGN